MNLKEMDGVQFSPSLLSGSPQEQQRHKNRYRLPQPIPPLPCHVVLVSLQLFPSTPEPLATCRWDPLHLVCLLQCTLKTTQTHLLLPAGVGKGGKEYEGVLGLGIGMRGKSALELLKARLTHPYWLFRGRREGVLRRAFSTENVSAMSAMVLQRRQETDMMSCCF